LLLVFATATVIAAGASSPETGTKPAPPQADVELHGMAPGPTLAMWKAADRPVVRIPLEPGASMLRLPPGEGCLALVRDGRAPVTFRLALAPAGRAEITVPAWPPGVRLSGSVRSEDGEPLAASASLVTVGPEPEPGAPPDPCRLVLSEGGVTATTADPNGAFALGPIPAGAFLLTVTEPGYADFSEKLVLAGEPHERELDVVTLRAVARLELTLDLSQVDDQSPFVIVVERANLDPHPYQRDDWQEVAKTVVRDQPELGFTFAPGLHRVVFTKEDTDIHSVTTLMLAPGTNFVVLRPVPITVEGSVSDRKGPIEDARVRVVCHGHPTTVRTSEEGRYELHLWTATGCAVFVATQDKRRFATSLDLTSVDLGDRIEKSIEVPDNTIEGTVVDAATGDPIEKARISLRESVPAEEAEGTLSAKSDEKGHFEFKGVRSKEHARAVVSASADGYLPESQEVEVEEDGPPPDVRLELHKADRITGRVVGAGGEPVAGAMVGCCAVDPSGGLEVTADTDGRGEFTLDAAPGATIFAAAGGYTIGWAQAHAKDVVVRLAPRGAPVQVRLVDVDREPVPGVALTFSSPEAGLIPSGALANDFATNGQTSRTDADGVLITGSLPSGLYRVWLLSPVAVPVDLGVLPVPASGEVTLHVPGQ